MREAADVLALSSPALTRRIQALEQALGTSLFERQRSGLQLTSDGRDFLEATAPHMDALSEAIETISQRKPSMRLRIAVPSLFASQRLMPSLPSLYREFPQLQIDLDTAANRLARLGQGIDAAIVITDKVHDGLYSRLIEKSRLVAIGPSSPEEGQREVRVASDLESHSVLVHRAMPDAFSEWCKRSGVPEVRPLAVNYYDAGHLLLDAAAEGLGIAFMFESHLTHSTSKRLAQVLPGSVESSYSYWFVCEQSALNKRSVRIFHDWLFDRFSA